MTALTGRPRPGLEDAASAFIKPTVRAQPAYSLAAPAARRKLNQNESPFDVPAELKRVICERVLQAPWQRYPAFAPQSLLERLGQIYRWSPDGILVGNGSNELIQATLATTLGAEDTALAPTPTFSLYRLLTSVAAARYVTVPFGPGYVYDIDALIATASRERAKVIILNSPNNPTGSALPADAVERLLEKTDALLVLDEAYQDFGGPSALPLLPTSDRLVVLRTFSKALGMAGLRFGFALGAPAVMSEIAKGKLPYNVNLFTLTAAEVMLDHLEVRTEHIRRITASRDQSLPRLRDLPDVTVYPSAANFILIRFERVPARTVFRRLLDEYGILVRDVSAVPELAECLRISVGTDEDMDAVVDALATILSEEGAR